MRMAGIYVDIQINPCNFSWGRYSVRIMNASKKDQSVELAMLQSIEQDKALTQRRLATHLGVALGVANACLKSCIQKGLIKIEQTPTNRYLYFLTPKGFIEKSRLSANYIKRSLNFYSESSAAFKNCLSKDKAIDNKLLILCGISSLTEIALLWAKQFNWHIAFVYDCATEDRIYNQIPIIDQLPVNFKDYHFCLTAVDDAQLMYQRLLTSGLSEQLLVPEILNWVRPPKGE